jgi:hypothetical protein
VIPESDLYHVCGKQFSGAEGCNTGTFSSAFWVMSDHSLMKN